jgi:hypothetical protein
MIKRSKFIQICVNVGIFCIGIVVSVNVLISYSDVNPLTAYEFWGFGICPIVISLLFLHRVLQPPRIQKKKK